MKKTLLLIIVIVAIILLVGVLIYQKLIKIKETPFREMAISEKTLNNKKVAMILAFKDFRDEEYFVPREILEKAGVKITTVSTQMGKAIGADGGEVKVDSLLENLNPLDFDAIVFIGGPGALKYLDNENSYRIMREAVLKEKIMAAICISPVILAKGGILKGKKATVWSSAFDKSPIEILERNGAFYQKESVVVDGKIITANGPAAAREFGKAIVDLLK